MEEKVFFDGKWKALEKLGEGSFGTVYKAIKEQYGVKSYSAIKQIKIPQTDKDYSTLRAQGMTQSDIEKSYDSQVKKWIEEIQFLNQFKDDENIVSIEDFEVIERKDKPGRIINIRMELLQNIDDHVIDRTVTDKKVLKMASDILKALEDCEEKNVVHRDIKPENVFVNSRGLYKLGDFGEAKSIEKTVSNMSKKGTENYMAPEIYKGERGSRSVDTYSLGIMLYKYFNNNRLPFIPDYPNQITFEDRETALYKRMSGENMKPPVKASNNIARIILKACSYDPKDRYESAMEFRNDIEEERRAIKNPIKLFDFQEKENQKEESIEEDIFEKTDGIFDSNTDIKNINIIDIKNISDENEIDENKYVKDKNAIAENIISENKFDKTVGIYDEDNSNIKTELDKTVGVFGNENPKYDFIESEFEKKVIKDTKNTKNQFGFNQYPTSEEILTTKKENISKNNKNDNNDINRENDKNNKKEVKLEKHYIGCIEYSIPDNFVEYNFYSDGTDPKMTHSKIIYDNMEILIKDNLFFTENGGIQWLIKDGIPVNSSSTKKDFYKVRNLSMRKYTFFDNNIKNYVYFFHMGFLAYYYIRFTLYDEKAEKIANEIIDSVIYEEKYNAEIERRNKNEKLVKDIIEYTRRNKLNENNKNLNLKEILCDEEHILNEIKYKVPSGYIKSQFTNIGVWDRRIKYIYDSSKFYIDIRVGAYFTESGYWSSVKRENNITVKYDSIKRFQRNKIEIKKIDIENDNSMKEVEIYYCSPKFMSTYEFKFSIINVRDDIQKLKYHQIIDKVIDSITENVMRTNEMQKEIERHKLI